MNRDTIQGFMFGLAAGFLAAFFLKPPADLYGHAGDHRRADEGSGDSKEPLLHTISAGGGPHEVHHTAGASGTA